MRVVSLIPIPILIASVAAAQTAAPPTGRVAPLPRPEVKPSYAWPVSWELATGEGRSAFRRLVRDAGLRGVMLGWDTWAQPEASWRPRAGIRELVAELHTDGVCVGAQLMPVLAHPEARWLDRWRTGVVEPDGWGQLSDQGVVINCHQIAYWYVSCEFDRLYADGWEGIAPRDSQGRWIDERGVHDADAVRQMAERSDRMHAVLRDAIAARGGRVWWYETSEGRFDGQYLDWWAGESFRRFTARLLTQQQYLAERGKPGVPPTYGMACLWHPGRGNPPYAEFSRLADFAAADDAPLAVQVWPAAMADPEWPLWARTIADVDRRRAATTNGVHK